MPKETKKEILEILIKEYEKLKDEQSQRIGFRDNILYVTLVLIGGVVSFAMGDADKNIAILLVPWICIILGWTYLVNDEKISSIGKYIRGILNDRIRKQVGFQEKTLFGWEIDHKNAKGRFRHKLWQFFVDEMTFCLSGIISVGYYFFVHQPQSFSLTLCSIEVVLLVGLGIEILIHANFNKD